MNALSTAIKFFTRLRPVHLPQHADHGAGPSRSRSSDSCSSPAPRRENRKVWAEVLPVLQKGQFKERARHDRALGRRCGQDRQLRPSPACRARARREDFDAAMEEGMMEIVPRLEKRTHYIATFANVITLVGLLGTNHRPDQGLHGLVAQVNPAEKAELLSGPRSRSR